MPVEQTQRLRVEAVPVEEWTLLDAGQKSAAQRVLAALQQATEELSQDIAGASSEASAPWLSRKRLSRHLFLSGGRGAGKTTLLLSLVAACGNQPPDGAPVSDKVRGNVIWLEPIEMESAPESLHVFPAILARIAAAVGHPSLAGPADRSMAGVAPRGLLETRSDFQDSLIELQRLQANIAVSWSTNLDARAPYLDIDSYAAEVMRVEQARLKLNKNLERVLEQLAAGVTRRGAGPLFVLPIDDIDLDPTRCLSVLRLLRLISVPRLFVLILGDIDVVDAAVRMEISSRLAGAAGPAAAGGMLAMPPAEVGALAGDLASNVKRKLIPPSQCIALQSMTLSEALNLRPLDLPDAPRMYQRLAMVPVTLDQAAAKASGIANLLDFLLARMQGIGIGKPATLPAEPDWPAVVDCLPYSGLRMLQTSARRLVDLWHDLQQHADAQAAATTSASQQTTNAQPAQNTPAVEPSDTGQAGATEAGPSLSITLTASYCRDLLGEDRAFTPEQRHDAMAAVAPDPEGGWRMRRMPLTVAAETGAAVVIERRDNTLPVPRPVNIRANRLEGVRFAVVSTVPATSAYDPNYTVPTAGAPREIALATAGAVTAFHDLLALQSSAVPFVSPLLSDLAVILPCAATEWQVADGVAAIEWPAPPFRAFWECELFVSAWNESLPRSAPATESDVTALLAAWMNAGTYLLTGTSADNPALLADTRLDALVGATRGADARARQASDWLISMALLSMPESGMLIYTPVTPTTASAGTASAAAATAVNRSAESSGTAVASESTAEVPSGATTAGSSPPASVTPTSAAVTSPPSPLAGSPTATLAAYWCEAAPAAAIRQRRAQRLARIRSRDSSLALYIRGLPLPYPFSGQHTPD